MSLSSPKKGRFPLGTYDIRTPGKTHDCQRAKITY